jgi:hypothetical protein
MRAHPLEEATRVVGVAQDGVYPLHIFDSWNEDADCNQMSSFWKPSEVELAVLNGGGMVCLTILGNRHPPVHVEVVK